MKWKVNNYLKTSRAAFLTLTIGPLEKFAFQLNERQNHVLRPNTQRQGWCCMSCRCGLASTCSANCLCPYIPFDKRFEIEHLFKVSCCLCGLQSHRFSISHAWQSRVTESAVTNPEVLTGKKDADCTSPQLRSLVGFFFSHLFSVGSQVATERNETTHQLHQFMRKWS